MPPNWQCLDKVCHVHEQLNDDYGSAYCARALLRLTDQNDEDGHENCVGAFFDADVDIELSNPCCELLCWLHMLVPPLIWLLYNRNLTSDGARFEQIQNVLASAAACTAGASVLGKHQSCPSCFAWNVMQMKWESGTQMWSPLDAHNGCSQCGSFSSLSPACVLVERAVAASLRWRPS